MGVQRSGRRLTPWTQERNQALIASRQNDPTVKQREHSIQSLELAYHKCKEIEGNLAEGTRVSLLTYSIPNRRLMSHILSSTKIFRFSSQASGTNVSVGRTTDHLNLSRWTSQCLLGAL